MQISFYVLSGHSQDSEPDSADSLLNFVCRLTQTVLAKSSHSLLIVDSDEARLTLLDERLWSFDATSFVPHDKIASSAVTSSIAPVMLTDSMPAGFDGVVLNLAPTPLVFTDNASDPERVLEIIASDDISKAQGREKYKHYKQAGFAIETHKIG